MDVFVFVLAIIIITTIAGLIKEQMKQRRKMDNAAGADQQARIDKLEERVATLERILTDDKSQLRQDIDALRHG
jgi:phage shock protein B